MNNCLINIRIGMWHFQIDEKWNFRLSKNQYHRGYPDGRFAVYSFFGWSK